jgi:hypothetical protein
MVAGSEEGNSAVAKVGDQIFDGMEVFDIDGLGVGRVTAYDARLGYFKCVGGFSDPRYVPFLAVERIEPTRAWLNVSKDIVAAVYKRSPEIAPSCDDRGRLTGGATTVSGWDRKRIPLDARELESVRAAIHEGTPVFDVAGKKLGDIAAYDRDTGYVRIHSGTFVTKEVFLPATTISFVDDEGIHLAEDKDTLLHRYTTIPAIAAGHF